MPGFIGPKGKQIPDHSLEVNDLPLAPEEGMILISNAKKKFQMASANVLSGGDLSIEGGTIPADSDTLEILGKQFNEGLLFIGGMVLNLENPAHVTVATSGTGAGSTTITLNQPVSSPTEVLIMATGYTAPIILPNERLFVIGNGELAYSDDGTNFTTAATWPSTSGSPCHIAGSSDALLAVTMSSGSVPAYKSTDGGLNWSDLGVDPLPGGFKVGVTHHEGRFLVHTTKLGVSTSDDGGVTWQQRLAEGGFFLSAPFELFVHEGVMFLGGLHEIYRSLDGGDTWVTGNVPNNGDSMTWRAFGNFGGLIVALGRNINGTATGWTVSEDLGATWSDPTLIVGAVDVPEKLVAIGDYLVGSTGGMLYRTPHPINWDYGELIVEGSRFLGSRSNTKFKGQALVGSSSYDRIAGSADGLTWGNFAQNVFTSGATVRGLSTVIM